jgi:hypothetical protein
MCTAKVGSMTDGDFRAHACHAATARPNRKNVPFRQYRDNGWLTLKAG